MLSALQKSVQSSESPPGDTVWGQGRLSDKATFVLRIAGMEMLTTRICALEKGEEHV